MARSFEKQIAESPALYAVSEPGPFGFFAELESPVNTIYVGDSLCDLNFLMAADVGIIIRNEEGKLKGEQLELKRTLGRLTFVTAWSGELKDEGGDKAARLWWAKDFDEVVDAGISGGETNISEMEKMMT